MRVRIFGDSHTSAMTVACARAPVEGIDLKARMVGAAADLHSAPPFFAVRDGRVHITKPGMAERLDKLLGCSYLHREGELYGLCMGMHAGRIFRNPAWSQFAPWTIAAELGLQPVTEGAMRTFFMDEAQHVFAFFDALAGCGIRFFILSGAPPRYDHRALKTGTSPRVVRDVVRAYRGFALGHVQSRGYRFIDIPEGVTDEEGFLKPEYHHALDQNHANWAYASLYLRKIAAELQRQALTA